PSSVPFSIGEFWHIRGGFWDWCAASWPIFAWGAGLTAIVSLLTRNTPETNSDAEVIIVGGFLISLWAGIMEEICFRWLIFLGDIVMVQIGNFLFFGFLGFGIPEWLFTHIFRPIADFFTGGNLTPQLFHPAGWFVGAGLLAANASFRDGHKYQGLFGLLNSWFIGMFLFWLMFQYGLLACIVVHFLYDLFIFAVRYIDDAVERALGWT
ncbi:MAG: hypothetical protein Q7R79_05575, partial [bacterium]|nr:hypothetical protein [bacterium]